MKLTSFVFTWLVFLAASRQIIAVEPTTRFPDREQFQLYLLIGQSNMAGRGAIEEQDKAPHPRVLTFTKGNAWTPAVDPLHFDKPAIAGVGLGSAFGRAMADAHPDATIGLVPCAVGGTPLARWQKDGDLYLQAIKRAKAAMQDGRLKGILWHQGESDAASEDTARSYGERLAQMVRDLRKELDAGEVPLVAGELGGFLRRESKDGKPSFWPLVNEQIASLPKRMAKTAVVSANGLKHKGDEVHFDSPSLRELGQRYAKAMQELQTGAKGAATTAKLPNIIVILADDVGYGDLGCYGATKVKTPSLDRLANEGLRFTDGHAASATCTPTRYALITGQYPWRKQGTGILPGNAPLIIEPGSPTLPEMMKKAGYTTGVVGKWHLGLGTNAPDWNTDIKPGPLEIGFDYCYLIPATGDRVPCVYVENHRVVGLDPADPIQVSYAEPVGTEPTGHNHPELLKIKLNRGHDNTIINGISRIGYMSGGKAARWVDEDMSDVITRQATKFIEENKDRPFFLYFATHDAHVPRVPHARFKGTSQCGVRGDVIQELDASVGEVLATLDRLKLAENTLVIFSSDNGPVLDDGYADGAIEDLNGHTPAGPLKGNEYSLYEAGTRVPFIARWPARIKPGTSDALVCQVDLLASLSALSGQMLPEDAGPDSQKVLPALLGESKQGRESLVEHAGGLAIRKGNWKFIPAAANAGAKGKKAKGDAPPPPKVALKGGASGPELYNLADDLGETKNIAADHPEVVRELGELLAKIRDGGHSR